MTGQLAEILLPVDAVLPAASEKVTVHGTGPSAVTGPSVPRHVDPLIAIGALPGTPPASVQVSTADVTPTLSVAVAVTGVVVGVKPQPST